MRRWSGRNRLRRPALLRVRGTHGRNRVDSYDEEIQDWVLVVVTLVALGAGLACLRLGIRSLRTPRAEVVPR